MTFKDKDREEMNAVVQDRATCQYCFEEHGETIVKTKPNASFESDCRIFETAYFVCCNCGRRETIKREISYDEYRDTYEKVEHRIKYPGFNHEDYQFDPYNYTK